MHEPLSHYMRVGLIHFMAYPVSNGKGPVAETFRNICLDPFFEVAEITWIQDPEVRAQVKQMKEVSHLSVTFGAQPCLLSQKMNINDLDEQKRRKALQQLKDNVDEAYEMGGATALAFLSGPYAQETQEASYKALVSSTKELCAYAASKGSLKIALEVFDYDIDKKSLIGPADLASRFAKEIRQDYPEFGLMVDLSHIPLLHETIEESLDPVKEYIVHAHMGNCVMKDPSLPGYGDQHPPRFGFPNSENDVEELAAYLEYLLSIGFLNKENRPVVSFEVKPQEGEDPELVIANAKRTLLRAWAHVTTKD